MSLRKRIALLILFLSLASDAAAWAVTLRIARNFGYTFPAYSVTLLIIPELLFPGWAYQGRG